MHVEEQRAEIEECLAKYGRRPMELLNQVLRIDGNLIAVHCTHTDPGDMARFLESGGSVCVCPLTEANLGDGLPALDQVHAPGLRLSLGTDSNARIDFLEEMRWLEYGQRLRREQRGALLDPGGAAATALLDAATSAGALALGVKAGRLEPGHWADLVAIDLDAPALIGVGAEHLLEGLVFGAGSQVVSGTLVGGRWRRVGAEATPDP